MFGASPNRPLAAGCAAALISCALAVPALTTAASADSVQRFGARHVGTTLSAGHSLRAGTEVQSPNGRFALTLRTGGRLVLTRGTHIVWTTRAHGPQPRLKLRAGGNLVITSHGRVLWSTGTGGSHASRLVLGNDGVLALRSAGGTVWTNRLGNACAHGSGKRVLVDLSQQFARLCSNSNQVLTTPITSGASALGDATPTGTWRVQSKQRDRYLYPAGGGAYYVHYWVPYDGAYGMHDSPWQNFPYGSSAYRTRGSHGCVHFPAAAMSWMYSWVAVGTTVRIAA